MTRGRTWWRPEVGFFLAIWLALMIGGRSRLFRDPGTFWDTVVGEQILSSGRMIETDGFTFTFAGEPWLAHQWLGECALALIHRWGGLDSLLLATVTVLAGLYAWLAGRLIRSGLHWFPSAVLIASAAAASACHFHVRPHLATMVLLAVTVGCLCDFEARRFGLGRLLLLVPVFLVWTNIHGGMLGGFCTLVLAAGGWMAWKLLGKESPLATYRTLVPLSGLVLACGLTAFANPYSWRLPWTWISLMESPVLRDIIAEHAPPQFSTGEAWLLLAIGLLYLAVLMGTWPRWPRVTWLLPAVWFCLACSRVRHVPLFSLTAVLAVAEMLPYTRWAQWLARPGRDLFRFPAATAVPERTSWWLAGLLPAVLVCGAAGLQRSHIPVPVLGAGWARLDPDYWPTQLLPVLQEHESDTAGGTPIFNEFDYGGFLTYHTPGFRVFVDDRCELFGGTWLQEHDAAERNDTAAKMSEWEQRYGRFPFALTRFGSGFDRYFKDHPSWVLIQGTPTANFYRRRPAT